MAAGIVSAIRSQPPHFPSAKVGPTAAPRSGRAGHFDSCARNFGMPANAAAKPDRNTRRVNAIYPLPSLHFITSLTHLRGLARRTSCRKQQISPAGRATAFRILPRVRAPSRHATDALQLCDLLVDERHDLIVRFHKVDRLGAWLRYPISCR